MIPTVLLILALTVAVATAWQESGFDAALRLASQGEYPAALEAAAREDDALRRAQASVYVRHHAGDLRGALADARAGLALAPEDVWLLEQGAFVAVSLHEGALAADLCERLLAALRTVELEAHAKAAALGRAEDLLAQARALLESEAARRGALGRARTVSVTVLALSLLVAALLGFAPRAASSA